MTSDPFITDFDPPIGKAETLTPGLRRVVAPNASPMTFRGTNTYLLGEAEIAVIDPGPDDARHLDAIKAAVGDLRKISHVLVTHSHVDHSPLARRLARLADAPVLAMGDSHEHRSPLMRRLAETGGLGGGEGVDADFTPDIRLDDNQTIQTTEWALTALATPGHFSNHMCFAWHQDRSVFSGDHVMSWATTLVSPPDGDLTAFMASMQRMKARASRDRRYYPGHGAVLEKVALMLDWQIAHRQERESQIRAALAQGPASALELARRIYTEIPAQMIPLASRNVLAHLVDLTERNLVHPEGSLAAGGRFHLAEGVDAKNPADSR